jgi:hypothetical protein
MGTSDSTDETGRERLPDLLEGDMTPTDVIFALRNLYFYRSNCRAQLEIDRDIRDYLICALEHRHAARAHR